MKWLHATDLDQMEPALIGAYDRCQLHGAAFVAEEVQIRTPRHLKALIAACTKRGVIISPGVEAFDYEKSGRRVSAVQTNVGTIAADRIVVAAGAWSTALAGRLGLKVMVKPMRGQIVLLSTPRPVVERIVNFLPHYLLPREDGRLLIGTTMEDVGFDRRNTAEAIADMLNFAVKFGANIGRLPSSDRGAASGRPVSMGFRTWAPCREWITPSSLQATSGRACGFPLEPRWL